MHIAIRFVGLAPSTALGTTIEARLAHIDRLCPGVTRWRVSVTQEARRQRQGNPFSVHVEATLPGFDLAATRSHDEDAHIAVRDALDAIKREVQDAIRIRRGAVKQHAAPGAGAQGEPG